MKIETKKLVMLAMFSALSYIMVVFINIPVVMFLKYEPKHVLITIAGFIFGPISALIISTIVAFAEMLTISGDGFIGLVMNIIATASYACIASFIYIKGNRTRKSAFIGLIAGSVLMTVSMLLWNYLVTPIYLGIPREEVAKILLSAILPFNILKTGLNSIFTYLLYEPIMKIAKSSHVGIESANQMTDKSGKGFLVSSSFVLLTCISLALVALNRI